MGLLRWVLQLQTSILLRSWMNTPFVSNPQSAPRTRESCLWSADCLTFIRPFPDMGNSWLGVLPVTAVRRSPSIISTVLLGLSTVKCYLV